MCFLAKLEMNNCKENFNQLFEAEESREGSAFQTKLDEELENGNLKLVDDSSTFEPSNLNEDSQTANNILSFREELKLIKQEDEREREHFAKQIEV